MSLTSHSTQSTEEHCWVSQDSIITDRRSKAPKILFKSVYFFIHLYNSIRTLKIRISLTNDSQKIYTGTYDTE